MVRHGVLLAFSLCVAAGSARSAESPDALMDEFFANWDNNARVTAQSVAAVYAPEVVYYGRRLTRDGVLRDKLAFVRRWPARSYRVVPGSVRKSCDAGQSRCRIDLVLAYEAVSEARQASSRGETTVHLNLVRDNGVLKITSENGAPIHRRR
jgi:hypothetical protein